MNPDSEHLRLLSIFYVVVAMLGGLLALFPIIHLVVGIALATGHLDNGHGSSSPAALVGWFFIVFAATWMAIGLTFSVCLLLAARALSQRRRYMFCLVMACVSCAFMPFGTILGVFTILVLMRPSVKDAFGEVRA